MTRLIDIPKESSGGLHRPELERDACGVGVVAHIKGEKVERIVDTGSVILTLDNLKEPRIQELVAPDLSKWLKE